MLPCAALRGVVESRPMKAPNITRRDLLAAIVGAVVAAALLLLAGQRWQVVPVGTEGARAFQVDRWTGRAWFLAGDGRYQVKDDD